MSELVQCLVETTLSLSLRPFHYSNAAISSHNTRRWLFFIFKDNQWKLSQKNLRHDLAGRWECLRPLWNRLYPFSPLFWLFLVSGVKWGTHVSSMVMNRLKNSALLLWNIAKYSIATSSRCSFFHCEQTRQPSCAQLSHVQIFSQYAMDNTFWNAYNVC